MCQQALLSGRAMKIKNNKNAEGFDCYKENKTGKREEITFDNIVAFSFSKNNNN
jgi:hypothetical protein